MRTSSELVDEIMNLKFGRQSKMKTRSELIDEIMQLKMRIAQLESEVASMRALAEK